MIVTGLTEGKQTARMALCAEMRPRSRISPYSAPFLLQTMSTLTNTSVNIVQISLEVPRRDEATNS